MISQFSTIICKCGHVHFLDDEEIDTAFQQNQDIYFICGSCGSMYRIGADIEHFINPERICYNVYNYGIEVDRMDFTSENFKDRKNHKTTHKIIYSKGKGIPMKTGVNATSFFNDEFEDTWYPDFIYHMDGLTKDQIMEKFDEWNKDRCTVNMNFLIRNFSHDELKILSKFKIKGMDWTGMEFEKKD